MNASRLNSNDNGWLAILAICSLLALMLFSCKSSVQYIPVETIVTEKEIVRDTIVIHQLKVIRDTIVVNDTISYLQNEYAESWAMWSFGKLHHSLNIKQVDIPIEIRYKDRWRETIKEVPIEVEIVKYKDKPYTWYEKLLMAMGILLIAYFGFTMLRRFK